MVRSWKDRLLGGVCGGLSQLIPLNVWIWRLLFAVLALATSGWGLVVYLLWWWLLPLETPYTRPLRLLPTLLALLCAVFVIGGYVVQTDLTLENGTPLYPVLVLVVVAVVYFLRQLALRTGRGSIVTGLVFLALAITVLLAALGALPPGTGNILGRAAGGVLVFLGLSILLRDRVALGSVLALGISAALVVGMAAFAYSTRINEQRTDNVIDQTFELDEAITTLQLNLTTLDTDVALAAAAPGERRVTMRFVGSLASTIETTFEETGALATLTLTETRGEGLPSLEDIGRGSIVLGLPEGVAIATAFRGVSGQANFNMGSLNLERLNADLSRGDLLITFPVYQPLSPSVAESPGEIIVRDGNLRMVAGPELGGQFLINKATNQRPTFDDLLYALEDNLNEWLLIARQYTTSSAQIRYVLTVPRGQIRLDTATGG
jgi:phage shock protein PspC (stress-responsive transcriptional regulator)